MQLTTQIREPVELASSSGVLVLVVCVVVVATLWLVFRR